jgi:hypothetical protein
MWPSGPPVSTVRIKHPEARALFFKLVHEIEDVPRVHGSPTFVLRRDARHSGDEPPLVNQLIKGYEVQSWRLAMLQREQQRRVRLGIELEADALLSISGVQAYSIALKRAEEASSDEMVRDWSVVAATVARKSGLHSSLLDALFG